MSVSTGYCWGIYQGTKPQTSLSLFFLCYSIIHVIIPCIKFVLLEISKYLSVFLSWTLIHTDPNIPFQSYLLLTPELRLLSTLTHLSRAPVALSLLPLHMLHAPLEKDDQKQLSSSKAKLIRLALGRDNTTLLESS